jgi:hypothetical protein
MGPKNVRERDERGTKPIRKNLRTHMHWQKFSITEENYVVYLIEYANRLIEIIVEKKYRTATEVTVRKQV